MSKKILSVVLALVFIISTFAVSAFAIEGTRGEDEGATYKQTWVLENDGDADGDGVWTVYVKLTTDYKVGAMQFVVNNPNDKVKLTSAELGEDVPEDYGAELTPNLATGKMVIVPQPVNGAAAEELTDAIVAVLTYTVPDDESTTLTIDASEAKTESNLAGTLVALRMADEYLETGDMIFGQIVDATAAKTQLGSASVAPELAVIDGTIGVVDNAAGWVYGIDAINGETAEDVFEVTNGGYFETTNGTATGSVLTVYTADGEEVATYTIIVFGDVNADGAIDSADAGYICDYEAMALDSFEEFGISDDLAIIAGDITGEGACDSEDAGIICDYEAMAIDSLMDLAAVCEAVYSYNN